MIFDFLVLSLALFLVWVDRVVVLIEDGIPAIRRCFVQRLSGAWAWLCDHELCPCALLSRAIWGEPAPLGWISQRWQLQLAGCGYSGSLCVRIDETLDGWEARYGN